MTVTTERIELPLELSHLRREARTALELAIVTLGPSELTDRLAACAGYLEAIAELPTDGAPVAALLARLAPRTRSALEDWQRWQREHQAKMPRG